LVYTSTVPRGKAGRGLPTLDDEARGDPPPRFGENMMVEPPANRSERG